MTNHGANEKAPGGLVLFLLGFFGVGVEWVEFFFGSISKMCSHQVFNLFMSGSQNVPQVLDVFPKIFTLAPHFFGSDIVWPRSNSMYTYLLTYNLASLNGPNSARARTHLTLSLMKQFRSNRLTLH
jgi:hypothetical protein